MYKIYINNIPLTLISNDDFDSFKTTASEVIRGTYLGKPKFFFPYIDMLEKQHQEDIEVIIKCKNVVKAFDDFSSLYEVIEAGGGLVKNQNGQVLVIFRRGFWDLPKGKMDPGENILQTAVREVKEETGIKDIELKRHLITTYHTYRKTKGTRVLKVTKWFKMRTMSLDLHPQTEEDIEKAEWVNLSDFLSSDPKIFNNIIDVIKAAQKPDV